MLLSSKELGWLAIVVEGGLLDGGLGLECRVEILLSIMLERI